MEKKATYLKIMFKNKENKKKEKKFFFFEGGRKKREFTGK